jgi:hypothetical protein
VQRCIPGFFLKTRASQYFDIYISFGNIQNGLYCQRGSTMKYAWNVVLQVLCGIGLCVGWGVAAPALCSDREGDDKEARLDRRCSDACCHSDTEPMLKTILIQYMPTVQVILIIEYA